MSASSRTDAVQGTKTWFPSTHWSVVEAAGQQGSAQASAALEKLCGTYWYPIYAYLRRRGVAPEDAQDLTQAFLGEIIENGLMSKATRERGRFRSFLLTSLQHFVVDQHRRAHAEKRGGGQFTISLDAAAGEDRFCIEPHHDLTPEKLYERAWAQTLLDHARSRLREEYAAIGKAHLYFALKDFPLAGKSERSFQGVAAELEMTVGALKSAVYRLRARYRELVREEVAKTVGDPRELNEEVRHLLTVISG